jgi:hypothetical protein
VPIEASVITGPLKVLLGQPDRYIIRRLKVLEARYTRYKIGSDIARGRVFDVRTDFLTAVSEQSAATIAWKMTQEVMREFDNLNINGLLFHDDHLRHLALKWDQMNHDAEEVAAAGGLDGKLRDIARVRIWNFLFISLASTSSLRPGTLQPTESFLSLRHFEWDGASTTSGREHLDWVHQCQGESSSIPVSAAYRPFTSVHIPFHHRIETGTS